MRLFRAAKMYAAAALQIAGFSAITVGLHQVYEPAAFIFGGAALAPVAQGLERDR
jgi:hypothetical protein